MRFGCCSIEVRPCQLGSCCTTTLVDIIYSDQRLMNNGNMGVFDFAPTLVAGEPVNLQCGLCPTDCCTCCPECHVILPGPVCDVSRVIVNGRDIGKSQYTLYRDGTLAFTEVGETVVIPTTSASLTAPVTQPSGFTLTPSSSVLGGSVELSDIGSTYQFVFDAATFGHKDVSWVLEFPEGGSHELHIFQPQNFDAHVIAGGDPTLVVNGADVQVGPPTLPNTPVRVLFRAPKDANTDSIIIKQDTGSAIKLAEISWTDPTTGPGGCPTKRTITGPVSVESELAFAGGSSVVGAQSVSFDTTPSAFVATNDGFGNYSAINATTPMSFTFPVLHALGAQPLKVNSAATGGSNVWSLGGVPLTWTPGPVVGTAPITSNTNSAGYYAVLTPLGLGIGVMNADGPAAAIGDSVFQYNIEFFQTRVAGANCQDYSKANGETGTWSVVYTIGEPVPEMLNTAAGLYACELAKSMLGEACSLPTRVQAVARQGVQIAFVDPIVLAEQGLTGLPIVDNIITTLNPNKLKQASYVWYPGQPKFKREV